MPSRTAPGRRWPALAYALMLAAAVTACLAMLQAGSSVPASRDAAGAAAASAGVAAVGADADALLRLLVALAAVLAIGQGFGRLCARFGQPPVIGEVIGGIALGPSILGRVSPDLAAAILPDAVAPLLGTIAQLGAILYMFLVGVDLDFDSLRTRARATVGIAHAGIALPFVFGIAAALGLYPGSAPAGVPFVHFALFLGVALSVTAFPVLARILADGGIQRTELGKMALGCAAVADVTAWCLLALVIGLVRAGVWHAMWTVVMTGAFAGVMLMIARPAIARLVSRGDAAASRAAFAGMLLALLVCASVTEAIGVHAIFGAFLLGALVPSESALAHSLNRRLDDVVTTLLLPAFFAVTGLRMHVGLLNTVQEWLLLGALVLLASVGKIGGTLVAARVSGLRWRPALGLGLLMNTRGLMELIVLNIGLDLGILSSGLFTAFVLMAILTTVATAPSLHVLGAWPRDATLPAGRVGVG